MTTMQTLVFERNRSLFLVVLSVIGWVLEFYAVAHSNSGLSMGVPVLIGIGILFVISCQQLAKAKAALLERKKPENWTLEDRIDELERLKHDNLISPEEYAGCCLKL